eukprot:scaffold452418_cov19-Prasinocladus_malaysianus.AAC.1
MALIASVACSLLAVALSDRSSCLLRPRESQSVSLFNQQTTRTIVVCRVSLCSTLSLRPKLGPFLVRCRVLISPAVGRQCQ